ncbi:MAG: hypothetical protein L6306_10235 [Planctomycetales bacterium]|nr:hypothetical protein [Planctomycetales bacterium]
MKQRIAQRRLPLKPALAPWPPVWAELPSIEVLEALSQPDAGQRQAELFPEPPAVARDQSRAGRLRRLTTADKVAPRPPLKVL